MALTFMLISEFLLPKYADKPQMVDFMQVSVYGKVRPVAWHAERLPLVACIWMTVDGRMQTPAIIEEVVGVAFATSAFCNLLL
jgi:hypothetical protein